eukprot:1569698-Pleurochrysis_carterae.AAC.2
MLERVSSMYEWVSSTYMRGFRRCIRGCRRVLAARRHFNNIALEGDYIIKTAARAVLQGEMFFYERMPADIADLFPKLISKSSPGCRTPMLSPQAAHTASADASAHAQPLAQPHAQAQAHAQAAPASAGAAMKPGAALEATATNGGGGGGAQEGGNASGGGGVLSRRTPSVRPICTCCGSEAPGASGTSGASGASGVSGVSGGGVCDESAVSLITPPSPSSSAPVAAMTLQRIHGVTFSHLVTSRSLTPGRFASGRALV